MKNKTIHIFLITALMIAVFACHKDEPALTGQPILLSPAEAGETRGLLEETAFFADGNQIQVYDFYTSPAGTTSTYIDGDIAQSNGNTWPFNGKHEWTQDGVHTFFGWLVKDNSNTSSPLTAENFFGQGFGLNNNKELIIPSTTIQNGSNAFDFMYSNITPRNLNGDVKDFGPVPMDFYHLYTSFSIAAYEVAEYNDYKIEYIKLEGITATNSATINYNVGGDMPVVTYGTGEKGNAFEINPDQDIVLGAKMIDLTTGTEISASNPRQYVLAWPQTARSISLTIGYKAKDVSGTSSDAVFHSYTKKVTIPYAWEPGNKNNINIEFKDKEISLTYDVEPWTVMDEEIDFSNQVTVDATIEWVESTVQEVDYTTGEVLLFDDMNIEATGIFTILTPKGATWTASLISKEGHPDAFRFVDGTKFGVVGRPDTLKLAVTNLDPVSPRHVCELLITVQTADGRTIIVDDILTPEEDEDGQPTDYVRFKIVQNLIN